MNWLEQIDGYCERTDFTYWSEPLNAVTNAAFLIAALIMWRRVGDLFWGRVLCVVLFAIGLGSYLFHTHATAWAALADVAPIGIFILVYLFLVNWHVLSWPLWAAVIGTLGFLPYAAGVTIILSDLPFFGISNFYWTVPILLVIYGVSLRHKYPLTSRGFIVGALILVTSIILRSIDELTCGKVDSNSNIIHS